MVTPCVLTKGPRKSKRPVFHGAVHRFVHAYRNAGIAQPTTLYADSEAARRYRGETLVIAPPSAAGSSGWLRKFGPTSLAFASGWMRIRGARRRRAVDRGFVLSDHADWDGLLTTIRATGAERIGVTHGYTSTLVRYLIEQGMDAFVMPTRYEGETTGDPIDNEDNTDVAQDVSRITGDETADNSAMISDASASSFGHDEE